MQHQEGALPGAGAAVDGRRPVQLARAQEAAATGSAGDGRRRRGPARRAPAAPRAGRGRALAARHARGALAARHARAPHDARGPPLAAAPHGARHAVRPARERGVLHAPAHGAPVHARPPQRGKHRLKPSRHRGAPPPLYIYCLSGAAGVNRSRRLVPSRRNARTEYEACNLDIAVNLRRTHERKNERWTKLKLCGGRGDSSDEA